MLGIRTPTPLLYLSSLSCIEALILYSNFFLSCALLDVICIRMHNPIPTVFEFSQLSLSSFIYMELDIPTLILWTPIFMSFGGIKIGTHLRDKHGQLFL